MAFIGVSDLKFDTTIGGQDWLGGGSFGNVYSCTLPDGTPVAVKVPKSGPPAGAVQHALRQEMAALDLVGSHPNILGLVGPLCEDDLAAGRVLPAASTVFQGIIMERSPGTLALDTWLNAHYVAQLAAQLPLRWQHSDLCQLLCHLLAAVEHIHSLGAAHGDIKPNNMLLRMADSHVFLTDLGELKRLAPDHTIPAGQPIGGTQAYMAPEVLLWRGGHAVGPVDGMAADMFAVGATIRHIAQYAPDTCLYQGVTEQQLCSLAQQGCVPHLYQPWDDEVPDWVRQLAERCMAFHPAMRPTAAEALAEVQAQLALAPQMDQLWAQQQQELADLAAQQALTLSIAMQQAKDACVQLHCQQLFNDELLMLDFHNQQLINKYAHRATAVKQVLQQQLQLALQQGQVFLQQAYQQHLDALLQQLECDLVVQQQQQLDVALHMLQITSWQSLQQAWVQDQACLQQIHAADTMSKLQAMKVGHQAQQQMVRQQQQLLMQQRLQQLPAQVVQQKPRQ